MPSICFLTSTDGAPRNDNHRRLPDAWEAAGWDVTRADHDDVRLTRAGVCIAPDDTPLDRFDLIWPIGLGARDVVSRPDAAAADARPTSLRHEPDARC